MEDLFKTIKNWFQVDADPEFDDRTDEPYDGIPLTEYPKDVLFAIFLRCDAQSLPKLCLTCRLFNAIISEPQFLIAYCEFHDIAVPPIEWRRFVYSMQEQNPSCVFDYRLLILGNPYRENLCPPILFSKEEMVDKYGWRFFEDGSGLVIERPPVYCQYGDIKVAFATSFQPCGRVMQFDLTRMGVQDWVMDRIRPRIVVQEWVAARQDCGSVYELNVQLLQRNELMDLRAELPRFKKETRQFAQWSNGEFVMVEVVIENYPVGMRKLAVQSSGKDTQYWAGHYGSKFGNTVVRLEFPEECRYLEESEFPEPEKRYLGGMPVHLGGMPVHLRGMPVHLRRGRALGLLGRWGRRGG